MVAAHEILTFLQAIETGDVTLTPARPPDDIFAGEVTYHASNGWTLVVFNDCDDWDYIDAIVTDDGRRIDYDDLAAWNRVFCYRPDAAVAWQRYGIGYDARQAAEGE